MKRLDESMGRYWGREGLRRGWCGCEEESLNKGEEILMRRWERDMIAGWRRGWTRVPRFTTSTVHPWIRTAGGGKRRRRIELEKDEKQVDDQLPRRHIPWLLIRIKECHKLDERCGAGAAKGKAANVRGRECLEASEQFVEDLIIMLLFSAIYRMVRLETLWQKMG
jgi:hypothetical protein